MKNAACLLVLLLASCETQPANTTQYNLGVDAYKTKNYKEAAAQWSKAAEDGDINAMNNLGYLDFYGLGTIKDQQRGISLWRSAAMKGQSESQWHLGTAYEAGAGVEQSAVEAYAWYRCAVETASTRTANGDATEQQIANDARESLVKLTDTLAPEELVKGKALAQQYISQYVSPGH